MILIVEDESSNTNITFKEHLKVLESNVLSKSEINLECNTLLNFKFGGGDGMRMLNKPPCIIITFILFYRRDEWGDLTQDLPMSMLCRSFISPSFVCRFQLIIFLYFKIIL